jgi:hypothetical protein
VHFDTLGSWESHAPLVLNVGRLIFCFALFPTGLLLSAIAREGVSVLRSLARLQLPRCPLPHWLVQLSVAGYIAFDIIFVLRYRDYSFMKALYLFPAFLAFLTLWANEYDRFLNRFGRAAAPRLAADTALGCLLILYTADVVVLIDQLSTAWLGL